MDYKNTLNLPKTSFPMKGNLPQTEPKVLERWDSEKLYEQIQRSRAGAEPFILHDGPPYANGDIHIGHALNKVLKDFIVRYQTLRGRRAPYVPGWDCHGLPIEYALMKELKTTQHQVDIVKFRKEARQYARKYVGIQREQFKRLGMTGDWEHPYLTLDPEYVASELRALKTLAEKGFIYQARKPVNWCWNCETALAEAEVEYEDHTSPSVYVKFPLTAESRRVILEGFDRGSDPRFREDDKVYLVIWTTTPWTLMGNVAVAVHPDFEYGIYSVGPDEEWIVAADLPQAHRAKLPLSSAQEKGRLRGSQMDGWSYSHPMGLREGKVVLADDVTLEEGTGLVHTAPGFGAEDFLTGRRYGLEVLAPVDSRGRFSGLPDSVSSFEGKHVVKEANDGIIALLKKSGVLAADPQLIQHSYPHCWRCREPIIFRATDQWFLKVDPEGLRGKLLELIEKEVREKKVRWIPAAGRERIAGMIKTRPDWCLSRQRLWGVPIPAIVCKACRKADLVPAVIENFLGTVESDPEGTDRWFSEPVSRWLPAGFVCRLCKRGKEFEPGTDILDVWFDSGVSHRGVLARRPELRFPADLYLEGSDQHRGWFQVSLITSAALLGEAPYRSVLTHGFVVDGQGRKMSKSLGNVISPQKIIDSMGADVLRLWVAASDYAEDVRLSQTILAQTSEMYRKIRNTLRFCLANLADFTPRKPVGLERIQELDGWILSELERLRKEVTREYEDYAYHKVVKLIHEFCILRLSNVYLDAVKDLLYTAHPDDPRRRSVQIALHAIASTLIRLLAPILPFTAEEAWAVLSGAGAQSVHLESWPFMDEFYFSQDADLMDDWEKLLKVRDQVMKKLEEARVSGQIGDPLEAELKIEVAGRNYYEYLDSKKDRLASICIVSKLEVVEGQGPPSVIVRVSKAPGAKCQRCWMRLSSVGQSAEHPTLCGRCVEVLKKLELAG